MVEERKPEKVSRDQEIETLFRLHFARMRHLATLMIGNREVAEEIAMEAFVRTLAKWGRSSTIDRPEPYIRMTVINLCRSRWRRSRIEAQARLAQFTRVSERDDAVEVDSAVAVRQAIRSLPPRQRACVVLRYFEDLSDEEISEALGCSTGTVKSQLSKARGKLYSELDQNSTGATHV